LISYILRLASPVEPRRRLEEVLRQLSGIGGGRPMGFGPKRVRSLPDGVAQILEEYITEREERLAHKHSNQPPKHNGKVEPSPAAGGKEMPLLKIGDLCPECGEAAFVNEEGAGSAMPAGIVSVEGGFLIDA
jgi:ribonucleoside-diphosphate reductase alpha chain